MRPDPTQTYSAFDGSRRIATGALADVALAAARATHDHQKPVLVFSDTSGDQIDLDLRGSAEAIRARYGVPAGTSAAEEAAPRGRGRPKLGVVAREVTLLPDQWEWLSAQPGGASVALRKLVQQARRAGSARERMRRAQERSYKVMVTLAGNLPGFEEAARALFAGDAAALQARIKGWPKDVRDHVLRLADPEFGTADAAQDAAKA